MIIRRICMLAALTLLPEFLYAQVAPEALGGGQTLFVGGEYSNFWPDFGPYRMSGIGVYADFNWNYRLGIEGEARFLRFHSFYGENQSSYLVGPRISFFRHGKLRPYGKFLFGAGEIRYPFEIGNGSYFAYAPGAGVDYRLNYKFSLRAEYEYQFWPGAPGIPNEPSHGLTPNGFSVGVAYRIF